MSELPEGYYHLGDVVEYQDVKLKAVSDDPKEALCGRCYLADMSCAGLKGCLAGGYIWEKLVENQENRKMTKKVDVTKRIEDTRVIDGDCTITTVRVRTTEGYNIIKVNMNYKNDRKIIDVEFLSKDFGDMYEHYALEFAKALDSVASEPCSIRDV